MTVAISDFSTASIAALIVFIAVMIPRAVFHLLLVLWRAPMRKSLNADGWLLAIAAAFLVCAALGGVGAIFNARALSLLDRSNAVALTFVVFALPAVLQVMRAWANKHAKKSVVLSHSLVALAILSLPASMAIPTAALLQSQMLTQPAAATAQPMPADNPAAAFANDRFFTDNEVANDPVDYPIATWLSENLTWRADIPDAPMPGRYFYREIPLFTDFWIDQTTSAVTLDAADTFGVIVGRLTHVRANLPFSAVVFLYKLLCTLVLAAVTYDILLRPIVEGASRMRRRPAKPSDF